MMERSCTTGSDGLSCKGRPRNNIAVIVTPVPKRSRQRDLSRPGCDLIVAVRDRSKPPSPLTGRSAYVYRLIRCNTVGRPLMGGSYRLYHEADLILGTDGHVFKNRFGDYGVNLELVHPQKGGTELQAAADWYENECKDRS